MIVYSREERELIEESKIREKFFDDSAKELTVCREQIQVIWEMLRQIKTIEDNIEDYILRIGLKKEPQQAVDAGVSAGLCRHMLRNGATATRTFMMQELRTIMNKRTIIRHDSLQSVGGIVTQQRMVLPFSKEVHEIMKKKTPFSKEMMDDLKDAEEMVEFCKGSGDETKAGVLHSSITKNATTGEVTMKGAVRVQPESTGTIGTGAMPSSNAPEFPMEISSTAGKGKEPPLVLGTLPEEEPRNAPPKRFV